jgi:hypothetical protein
MSGGAVNPSADSTARRLKETPIHAQTTGFKLPPAFEVE